MKSLWIPLLISFAAACTPAAQEPAQKAPVQIDQAAQVGEARMKIKEFATALGGHMKKGMMEGGPTAAIGVCNEKAPEVAVQVSEGPWNVGRTALKYRNAANKPDAWEEKVLMDFEAQKAAGTPIADLDYSEVVVVNGQQTFRYMKAIPTQAMCLKCHATDLDPAIEAKLKELYPDDRARGFVEGDIRGAFTLSKPL
ncbi:MAG: DUF3365 domain-containing protein [bacterium]|nr:DUF3365 domain-containing protein [bacterium]